MRYLPPLAMVYVSSAATTTVTAAADTYYVIDTAVAAVTVNLPAGVPVGHWIVIQNAPASGFQVGGTAAGHNVTVSPAAGESVEGAGSDTVTPPVSLTTAAGRRYFPVGLITTGSGFGAGWVTQ